MANQSSYKWVWLQSGLNVMKNNSQELAVVMLIPIIVNDVIISIHNSIITATITFVNINPKAVFKNKRLNLCF